jgi:hypothetical protein
VSTIIWLVILLLLVIVAAAVAFAVALSRRSKGQLAAGAEVLPGMPTGAPLEWAGQHSPEAKMHRRLVGLAATVADLPLGDAGAIERQVAVQHRIQELDRRLISFAVAPDQARRDAVAGLEPEVAAAEAEVGALATGNFGLQ